MVNRLRSQNIARKKEEKELAVAKGLFKYRSARFGARTTVPGFGLVSVVREHVKALAITAQRPIDARHSRAPEPETQLSV